VRTKANRLLSFAKTVRAMASSVAGRSLFSKRIVPSLFGEDGLPVVLHADEQPATLLGERQFLAQPSDLGVSGIGVFAPGVVVKHQHLQVGTFPAVSVLQHLDVAVGVTESGDRATADVLIDADRFAVLVVNVKTKLMTVLVSFQRN
jgi:hypothetical protein